MVAAELAAGRYGDRRGRPRRLAGLARLCPLARAGLLGLVELVLDRAAQVLRRALERLGRREIALARLAGGVGELGQLDVRVAVGSCGGDDLLRVGRLARVAELHVRL